MPLKTPLPEKFLKDQVYYEYTSEQDAINQIIDYLAELTEVIEDHERHMDREMEAKIARLKL